MLQDLLAASMHTTYRLTIAEYKHQMKQPLPLIDPDYDYKLICRIDSELRNWLRECRKSEKPSIYISLLNCVWIGLPIQDNVIVVGPALLGTLQNSQIEKACIQTEEIKPLVAVYENLPILPYLEMMRLSTHLIHLLTGGTDCETVFTKYQSGYSLPLSDDEMYDNQKRDFKSSRRTEAFLLDCVRKGDLERLGSLRTFSPPATARIAKDELRKIKNSFIVMLSIISRAAIEGGLPVEIAYPLSDVYLIQNESLTTEAQVWELHQTCALDYTRRVQENRVIIQYGKLTNRCYSYILSNLGENLKVKSIAAQLGVNPEYLSRQVKFDTGESILDFIHRVRIDEAKNLLRFSEMETAKIAAKLGFASQSQFTTQFKKQTGDTPNHYRTVVQNQYQETN